MLTTVVTLGVNLLEAKIPSAKPTESSSGILSVLRPNFKAANCIYSSKAKWRQLFLGIFAKKTFKVFSS
jgi:hypothetical protein